MNLNNLYSSKRTGKDTSSRDADIRSEFQRDFDRIIFSSSFRRLQNKTQVFPLPGSKVFVHNRLTHSLEVASVGRSLGTLIGNHIVDQYAADLNETSKDFYRNSLYNVISSACLCHDIGNPAFGHSGEDAIATFFIKNESEIKNKFESENQWADFINFEGNANAIRILTQQQPGKAIGGLRLTYSTLASIAKYPCESLGKKKGFIHRKKFGFFQSEKETFLSIAENTTMIKDSDDPVIYFRHPFVWLVEAADDVCYNIVDLEDAQRLGIIEYSTCRDILYNLIKDLGNSSMASIDRQLDEMSDKNEHISYLRAVSISTLVSNAVEIVKSQGNLEAILNGSFKTPMFDMIRDRCKALKDITEFSIEYIYNHRSVVEIENAGYNVMYELLSHFVPSILKDEDKRGQADKKAIRLIPKQYLYDTGTHYQKVMGVLDYVSGMTDNYAADLYKKIKGIEIGMTI